MKMHKKMVLQMQLDNTNTTNKEKQQKQNPEIKKNEKKR